MKCPLAESGGRGHLGSYPHPLLQKNKGICSPKHWVSASFTIIFLELCDFLQSCSGSYEFVQPDVRYVFRNVIFGVFNPRRHSPFRHPSRHAGVRPPLVWLLSGVQLRFKNQRVVCLETKPLTPEFNILGQPVTSEVRSMTQKWPKCEFADNFVSEQARAVIHQKVPYGLRNTMRYLSAPFGWVFGVKIQK